MGLRDSLFSERCKQKAQPCNTLPNLGMKKKKCATQFWNKSPNKRLLWSRMRIAGFQELSYFV
jgi:hypothetical protein